MRRLRYFVAVCEHGGFSRAASAIGVAQPALTRHIKLLETEIGQTLFNRNGRNALPTDVGSYLLRHARGHLNDLDRIVERIRTDIDIAPDKLVLGICPTIAPLFLDALRAGFGAYAPGAELSVIEAYSGDLRNLMDAGRIDLSLSYRPEKADGLFVTPLLTETLVFVAPHLTDRHPVSLADIAQIRLILPSRIHELRRIIDRASERAGVTLASTLEIDNLGSVKSMLASLDGDYATILPYHSVSAEVDRGMLFRRPISDPGMQRIITMIHPPSSDLPAGFVDLIHARAEAVRTGVEAAVRRHDEVCQRQILWSPDGETTSDRWPSLTDTTPTDRTPTHRGQEPE